MTASGLADAELHGLVDGRVEPGRRADLLRRLAASPADRAILEAWQGQADLIREAFREVPTEALPAALDLAPPRLRGVDPDRLQKVGATSAPARHGSGAAIATALLITIGLTLSWMAGSRDDAAATAETAQASTTDAALPFPTFRVPDLSKSGWRLADVTSDAADPATLVLRYRDAGGGRVALKIARNGPDIGAMPLEQVGGSLTWRSPTAAFTLDGTVAPDRLRAIAAALRTAPGSDE